jgi:bifunctional non-homologous end joining protein LigD
MTNSVARMNLPAHVQPMLATLARDLPADQEPWTFEIKWDGIRAIAFCDGGAVRYESRNLRDITVSWPELDGLARSLGSERVILDGEIVALDDRGLPSFQRLQERMHVGNVDVARRKAATTPVSFLVFDVLHLDGDDLMPRPWHERRAVLDELAVAGPHWATTPTFPGSGVDLLESVRQRGMEGVIAKRIDGTYVPGSRSRSWLKVKLQQTDEFVVGGWQPGEGRRERSIGSLLLGVPAPDGGLHYVGNVGTGFSDAELSRLADRLGPARRATSPFTGGGLPRKGSVFVEPELVVEVAYAERTSDGILRHPSYKGQRVDKGPNDVKTVGNG